MRHRNTNVSKGGVGISTVVLIVFIILKLVGVIDWSWWWVLSPLWISFALAIAVVLVALIVTAISKIINKGIKR